MSTLAVSPREGSLHRQILTQCTTGQVANTNGLSEKKKKKPKTSYCHQAHQERCTLQAWLSSFFCLKHKLPRSSPCPCYLVMTLCRSAVSCDLNGAMCDNRQQKCRGKKDESLQNVLVDTQIAFNITRRSEFCG